MSKVIAILLIIIPFFVIAQEKQNNSPGSEILIDTPNRIDISKDSVIPITVYIHDSNSSLYQNDLSYVNVSMKCASETVFDSPITFDNLSHNDFLQLFDSYSLEDVEWGSQSFLDALPTNDETNTVLFTADENWGIPPVPIVEITKPYFYFNLNIPFNVWSNYLCNDSVIDINVYVSVDYDTDTEISFRVFISNLSIPKLPNWYRGDTHFHTYFTQNTAENGFPLAASKVAAKHLGLDWITTTDHSCDFDNYGSGMYDNWARLGSEVLNLNNEDSSMVFIRGIEASVNNSQGDLVHCLVSPSPTDPFSLPYVLDAGGDLSSTNISIDMLLDSLEKYDGFGYAAHPFSEGDKLSSIIGGNVWNICDSLSPQNNEPALNLGNVIWNNLEATSDVYSYTDGNVIKHNLMGGQVWNLWYTLTSTDAGTELWNPYHEEEPYGFVELPETDYMHTSYRLAQNMEAYGFIVRKGLKAKFNNAAVSHYKFFLSGGSDSHGSFNFSNTDYVYTGVSGTMENNIPGSLSTLVYCPNGMDKNGKNVLTALKNGHSLMSSGPILSMTITCDSLNVFPGDDLSTENLNEENIFIHLQAISNNDYGNLDIATFVIETKDSSIYYSVDISGGQFTISLADFYNTIFSTNNYPENQYIAIRAFIETNKVYSEQQALLHRKNSEKYHSYTNPIWIKTNLLTTVFEQNSDIIRIYPNPTENLIYIDKTYAQDIESIIITSLDGKICNSTFDCKHDKICIDISCLSKGIYNLQIQSQQKIIIKKLVKT
ncbi:MAG TPA: hypothetical protein DDX39_07165 [Bacteroidales bacterium]|nr:MAG: hypothetical protein A2W98_02005 [Bacteroidetes bacterium GWF2_33_38]OFY75439.1 MAG: hypothetical protein A2265_11455 [Bacteroidetes bacterium RIFOXYA12_FULL_33_9]OFY85228.1 MAG: hypothetical protein A2236_10310 [Bacteroidetes bacterium RIFOXYA2_FULL_33_7]HBF88409.1 hypothetical protein [Bacteroidales bacterium]